MSPQSRRSFLYVTFDGILTPLGHSQVVRVVTALARRGLPYIILSLERAADLARAEKVAAMRDLLGEAGVGWHPLTYDLSGKATSAGRNLAVGLAAVMKQVLTRRPALIHARGYHSGLVAHAAQRSTGTPYLFDARGYWIDERVAEGRWFTRPRVYAGAKALERQIYGRAKGIVTLTELQADDLRTGRATGVPCAAPVTCITTTADFEQFVPGRGRASATNGGDDVPAELRARLADKLVVGLVGSLNGSYRADETTRLCRLILDEAPSGHLLVLSDQKEAYEALFARHQIASERYTITRASHQAMPSWLTVIDWAPLLLHENFAKRASMPTKLGEFFATGVRPVHYGCNEEVSEWVRRVGTGLVLPGVDEASLRAAARTIASSARDPAALARGRAIAAPHFSLAGAVDKYAELLTALTFAT
jgi:hypothetical protein